MIYAKMRGHCAYCGVEIGIAEMQVDHVIPLRGGGPDAMDNMLPACRACNHRKGGSSVEGFRKGVQRFSRVLERDSVTYRNAVRFGQVIPNPKPVEFYFEKQ